MTDLISSRQKIQVEETKYKATVSETTQQKIGGSINHILDNSVNGIGDVVQSVLSESSFQTRRGNNWVLMAGQSIAGSDLSLEEGINTLPDAVSNGAFFRQGASLLTYQGDTFGSHSHVQQIEGAGDQVDSTSGTGGVSGDFIISDGSANNKTRVSTAAAGSSETRPKNYQMNFFIKINNDPT